MNDFNYKRIRIRVCTQLYSSEVIFREYIELAFLLLLHHFHYICLKTWKLCLTNSYQKPIVHPHFPSWRCNQILSNPFHRRLLCGPCLSSLSLSVCKHFSASTCTKNHCIRYLLSHHPFRSLTNPLQVSLKHLYVSIQLLSYLSHMIQPLHNTIMTFRPEHSFNVSNCIHLEKRASGSYIRGGVIFM